MNDRHGHAATRGLSLMVAVVVALAVLLSMLTVTTPVRAGSCPSSGTPGSDMTDFWICHTTADTWTTKAAPPKRTGAGGALTFAGTTIHALRGDGKNGLWGYALSTS